MDISERKSTLSPPASTNRSRRKLLIGGGVLLLGGLAGGGSFFATWYLDRFGKELNHGPLVFETNWNTWSDFCWLSDTRRLACIGQQGEVILDMSHGPLMALPKTKPILAPYPGLLAWSKDGRYLAYLGQQSESAQGLGVIVLDIEQGQTLWTPPDLAFPALAIAWSPDSKRLAFAQPDGETSSWLQVWALSGWKLIWKRKIPRQLNGLQWSPDSARLATFGMGMQMRNASDGQLLWSANDRLDLASWSADGTAIAGCGGESSFERGVMAWDASTGQKLFAQQLVEDDPYFALPEPYPLFAWSPLGARLAFFAPGGEQPTMQVWEVRTAQRLFACQPLDGKPGSVSWSPDGKYLAAGNYVAPDTFGTDSSTYGTKSTIQFWDARNGQALFSYPAPRRPRRLTWSPDSHFLAAINPQTFDCHFHCGYGEMGGAGSLVMLQVFQITPGQYSAPSNPFVGTI